MCKKIFKKQLYKNSEFECTMNTILLPQGMKWPWRIDMLLKSINQSYNQFIQILHHWINASLVKSYEDNKGRYEMFASSSGILTMWRKANKVWRYCKVLVRCSGYLVMMLLAPKPCGLLESLYGYCFFF